MAVDTVVAKKQNQGVPTLLGASGPSSPWNFSTITGAINKGLEIGTGVYNTVKNVTQKPSDAMKQSPIPTNPAAPATVVTPKPTNWLLWGGLAAAGLVVLYLLGRR